MQIMRPLHRRGGTSALIWGCLMQTPRWKHCLWLPGVGRTGRRQMAGCPQTAGRPQTAGLLSSEPTQEG